MKDKTFYQHRKKLQDDFIYADILADFIEGHFSEYCAYINDDGTVLTLVHPEGDQKVLVYLGRNYIIDRIEYHEVGK